MKQGSLKLAKKAIAVGLSFVLVGTMSGDVTIINNEGKEVSIHHEDRALPEKFSLEPNMKFEEVDKKKGKSNAKTKVLVRPKNINRRYL